MPSGFVAPELRCSAKNRSGQQCGNAGVVFTDPPFCRFHRGHHPRVLAKAAERARLYELGMVDPLEPPVVRRMKLQAWEEVQQRLARRAMKKAGILDDYDQAAIGLEREDRQRRARLVRRLGAVAMAEQEEQTRRFNRWLRDGQRGPRPGLPGEEPAEQPRDSEEATGQDRRSEPRPPVAPEWPGTGEPAIEPQPVTTSRRSAPRIAEPAPTRLRLLERKGEARRARRSAELARRTSTKPQPEPERLPGGGVVHSDVLPLDRAEHHAESGPEPIPYYGFDFRWTV